ncbi:hypothetical protein B7494_g3329 [Chlorociboria aeruginascens]|nr:hypothetical protein B7494_g3329 [Chlorociboria aeruginascens]
MATLKSLSPLRTSKRPSHLQYAGLNSHDHSPSQYLDPEKYGQSPSTTDIEDDDDDFSEISSPGSSRDTSGAYSSSRPMLRRKPSAGSQRPSPYRLPHKMTRYLCLALISTLAIFMLSLVRMSIVSSRKVAVGDLKRPPPPPSPWESFEFLSRYYGGIRTLSPILQDKPEYPLLEDEGLPLNATHIQDSTKPIHEVPDSQPFKPYPSYDTSEYTPARECFLDVHSTVRVPPLQYYPGRPSGFPSNVMGSYDLLGLPEDLCFERHGRYGAYGYGYGLRYGGTGTGQHGETEGSDAVWNEVQQVDYRKVDWADAQKRCFEANSKRFEPRLSKDEPSQTFSVIPKAKANQLRDLEDSDGSGSEVSDGTSGPKYLPRTAIVIRTWDDFQYREEDILNLRAVISELSIASGGEYDVHLLVEVKEDGKFPIWADSDAYQKHINESVPEEFQGIATLWSQTQMLMVYQGLVDQFIRDLPVHGSYRGLQMAMQYFAHKHPEYDFFWNWEIDIRYSGHYYDFFSKIDSWTKKQPRKGLWERNSRFYIPSVHGSWEDFRQMARVQTEMGTDNANNIWSGVKRPVPGSTPEQPKGDKPIWGPERPTDEADWFEIENDPVPTTSYDKDKYVWGVDEDADLITFNPLFDPHGTTWLLAEDVTGYNSTVELPPRRASIVASSRMSRRLLDTMHRETAFKKHHAFTEMWAPTTALHHGYKAVYFPHPVYVDREWPTEYLASIMNGGRNGATGGARTSVFGDREHNFLGMSWYYNAGFAPNLWKRWLGFKVNNEGGEEFEMMVNEGRSGMGVNEMKGGEGRMCLPPMLIHPVKDIELFVEEIKDEYEELPESDPSA